MAHVLVPGDELDVQDSYMNLEPRLPHPEEVRRLSDISDVVGRLQVPGTVEVLQEHIIWRLDLQSWNREGSDIWAVTF